MLIPMASRRKFIAGSVSAVAGTLAASRSIAAEPTGRLSVSEVVDLCGEWLFRTDPDDQGINRNWQSTKVPDTSWRKVAVPHTWHSGGRTGRLSDGIAWYRRPFDLKENLPTRQHDCAVRIEFEAVFHSATVWVNSKFAGEHARKGYTAFTLDITNLLQWDQTNAITVRVDSAFNQRMLPRGRSSDWANMTAASFAPRSSW